MNGKQGRAAAVAASRSPSSGGLRRQGDGDGDATKERTAEGPATVEYWTWGEPTTSSRSL
jgi:hypothetical protein